ncbi:BREX-3 system P-loop-containing protein BrxF [Sphingomonas sp. PvP056]|uniref:BREX-3 system P-loop-containing protein BrxF n=1 Tax=Sphingomonas sp. PvP056 TaxID=3156392 RepID=UPI0033914354
MDTEINISALAERTHDLLADLRHAAPRPLLITGGSASERNALANALCVLFGSQPVIVGMQLAMILGELDHKPRVQDVLDAIDLIVASAGPNPVLTRIEGLFSPAVPLNAVDALVRMSRQNPICAVWPGRVDYNRLRYAQLGHPECVNEDASRAVIIDLTKENGGLK